MTRIHYLFLNSRPLHAVRRWAKRSCMPGANDVSLYEVFKQLQKEIRANRLNIVGAAVTYRFLMAIPPSLLFLFSLIPYLHLTHYQETIQQIIVIITPSKDTSAINDAVKNFMEKQHRDVLSIGILFTLYFSSNGMMGLMRVFDRTLSLYKKRGWGKRRWTSIKLTIMMMIVAIGTIAVLILQSTAINHFLKEHNLHWPAAVNILSIIFLILIIFCAISLIYTYGPSLTHRFKFFSIGSVTATLLCILLTFVFFFLVDNVLQYNKVYGSIGTVLAMMVWLYLNTQVILLGFMLNVAIVAARIAKNEEKAKVGQII